MSRRWLLSLLCLSLVALVFTKTARAHSDIRAYEAKTKLTFQELVPQLSLAVVNGSGPKLSTLVQVEFVAPNDTVVDAVFKPQSVQVIKHLNIKFLTKSTNANLMTKEST